MKSMHIHTTIHCVKRIRSTTPPQKNTSQGEPKQLDVTIYTNISKYEIQDIPYACYQAYPTKTKHALDLTRISLRKGEGPSGPPMHARPAR